MAEPRREDAGGEAGDAEGRELDEKSPLVEKEHGGYVLLFGVDTWLWRLQRNFGHRLLVMLFVVQHCQKGFMNAFTSASEPYLYKSYGVTAPQMQIYNTVTGLPWAMKPILGLFSDVMPILGYKKAPYMFLTSVLCTGACLALGLLPHKDLNVTAIVICIFALNLQFSTCDLLSEARYAEKIRERPSHGPALLTYVWFGMQVGSLAALLASGPVIATAGPKLPYLVATVPALAVMLPVALGYMEERKTSWEEQRETAARYAQQKEACALCFLMLGCGVLLTFVGIMHTSPVINCVAAIVVALVVLAAFSLVLSPVIAKFNAFSLIQGALALNIGGASFYFYTDNEVQYPGGPNFSEFFYNSVMGTLGSVCSLVGIYFYQKYMSTWKYRFLIVWTNVVASLLAVLDVIMFARLNKRIGLPDHVLVLGLSMLQNVIFQWRWMPQVVILSYLCPVGMEATMYALLAGCANLGNAVASNCGALLLHVLDCKPQGRDGEAGEFRNLWVAALVSMVLPLMATLVLIRLVPDARQDEKIVGDDETDATANSVLRTCCTGAR